MDLFVNESPYVYHSTKRLKAKTIQKEGFRPAIGAGSTSEMINEAVEASSFSFLLPFDRTEVTYFHVTTDLVTDIMEDKPLGSKKVVIVVDFNSIISSHNCYVADMDLLGDVIDISVGAPGERFDTIEEAAEAYEESVKKVSSYSDILSYVGTYGYVELLVEGNISSSNIVDIFE